MNLLSSAVRRIAYLVWHSRLRATLNRADACTLFGLDLVIDPGVLHPRHFASSRRLAQHLMSLDLRGLRVADIGEGRTGLGAVLARPWDVLADSAGNIYIADLRNHRVRRMGPNGLVTTIAGTGQAGFNGDGGRAIESQLNLPAGSRTQPANGPEWPKKLM